MNDFEHRKGEFLEAYGKLVQEFGVDFLTRPTYVPNNEERTWSLMMDTQIVDVTDMPVPSPLQM